MKRLSQFALIAAVALAVAGSLVGCQPQAAAPEEGLTTIRYGGQYYPGEFLLLGDPSIWSKYGIIVEHTLFSSGGEGNEALISGNVDINAGSDSKTTVLFNAIPDDALIIGTLQRGNRYTTIVRKDSPYQSWGDLMGKTVGTRFGTGAEAGLRKYFAREGYSWEDFEWVNLKLEDMIAALDNGQIEAFTAWEPTPAIAEAMGVGRMLRTYGDVALGPVQIHTTKEFAYNHEEEVVRFLAAHLDKADMIKNNPRNAAEIASSAAAKKGITVAPEAFETVFERIDFSIEFDDSIIQAINDTADFLLSQGKIEKTPTLVWDTSFLEKAKELRSVK